MIQLDLFIPHIDTDTDMTKRYARELDEARAEVLQLVGDVEVARLEAHIARTPCFRDARLDVLWGLWSEWLKRARLGAPMLYSWSTP